MKPQMIDPTKIILTTDHLILRTWKASDVPLIAAINADPLVMEHCPAPQDMGTTKALINRMNQHYKKFVYAPYTTEIKALGSRLII